MATTPIPPKLPRNITPEQEKQYVLAVKNGMPNNLPKGMDNKTVMKWVSRVAKILQNPVVARCVSCLATLRGTPVHHKDIIIGARIAQKAADERKEELEQGKSSGPSFKR